MRGIELEARAKVNLGLDVLGRRPDGYHEVRMVMQTVCLCDKLEIQRRDGGGILLEIAPPILPADEGNLAYRAARLLADEFGIGDGVLIRLEKHIPVAAGMAGGSADAAAVLLGMNSLFGLGLDRDGLMRRGLGLGADVPYCVLGGTALAEGIGERLTPLSAMPPCAVLIAKPPISVSTKWVYENLRLEALPAHPDIDAIIGAIGAGDLCALARGMGNVLETVAVPRHPVIAQIKGLMMEHGAAGAMMSGSGPTVFGLFERQDEAERACEAVRESGLAGDVFLTAPFQGGGA